MTNPRHIYTGESTPVRITLQCDTYNVAVDESTPPATYLLIQCDHYATGDESTPPATYFETSSGRRGFRIPPGYETYETAHVNANYNGASHSNHFPPTSDVTLALRSKPPNKCAKSARTPRKDSAAPTTVL